MEHFNAIEANIAQMKYCKKIIFRILRWNSIKSISRRLTRCSKEDQMAQEVQE